MNDSPEIAGLLHKRRGGFGKMFPNAWQFRFFVISKDGILSYFDSEIPDQDSKARGKIDLKNVSYKLIFDSHIEGAPTQYTIQIIPLNEEPWRMCADNAEDRKRWGKCLEKFAYDKPANGQQLKPAVNYTSDDEVDHKNGTMSVVGVTGLESAHSPIHVQLGIDNNTNNKEKRDSVIVKNELINSKMSVSSSASNLPSISSTSSQSKQQPTNLPPQTTTQTAPATKKKRGLKISTSKSGLFSSEWSEFICVIIILNICIYSIFTSDSNISKIIHFIIVNGVVGHTLYLRGFRFNEVDSALKVMKEESELNSVQRRKSLSVGSALETKPVGISQEKDNNNKNSKIDQDQTNSNSVMNAISSSNALTKVPEKPIPGFSFQEVKTEPKLSPDHSWCQCDYRQFNVRDGPDYNKHKRKAPSQQPLYEAFAVDVFCTKRRIDNASERFQLPDTSKINTYNKHVPPIFVIQIQMPSEPPPMWTSVEDGPGWAILMYYRITEETCNQLKDIKTASPAVKLFAEWCEKAPVDPAWRGRFKVIASCTNLEEMGMPSSIVAWNAKPVLIRRTGTIFRGPNYMEMNIHVHKFANIAKQSIYFISSRCGLMFMQIGFVIEGRDDKELPETLFACVAVNKPKEDQAEFLFDDDE
eukprot:gene12175-16305_t